MIFWQQIKDKLTDGQQVYLLTVIENFGSSPGRKGFKMLISEDQFIAGSVGGGVMEFRLVAEARELLLTKNPPTFIKKQIHRGNITDGSGMICSGEQTVAFHCLNADHLPVIQKLLDAVRSGEKGTLLLAKNEFDFREDVLATRFAYEIRSGDDWYFKEHIGYRDHLYIVGGGHVSVAVSELFSKLGFYVHVFDNRTALNTLENNQAAHQKTVTDYENIADHIPEGLDTYVVIMTNKYTEDKLAVQRLLRRKYAFTGVLGSKAKLKTLRKELLKEGFTTKELNTLHAPVGLPIKSETPDEIAVSIAAQIICAKNGGGCK